MLGAVGGIVDIIRSEVTGLLVPQKNPEALATAILKLLDDRKLAQQLGRRGLQDVQVRFDWSQIVPLWQKVFA